MRAVARRVGKLEASREAAPCRPTHFVGLCLRDATDEDLEAMAMLAKASELCASNGERSLHITDAQPELAAAAKFLIAAGADLSASSIVMALA